MALSLTQRQETSGSWSTCLPVHLLNRAELFIPSPIGPASMPRKFSSACQWMDDTV